MARLCCIQGGHRQVLILSPPTTIGREPENGLVLLDPRVSRRHALIERSPEGAHSLKDLGSKHGTFVNGRRVSSTVLADGDEITIGTTVLTFEERAGQTSEITPIIEPDRETLVSGRFPAGAEAFPPEEQVGSEEEIRRDYRRLRAAYEFARAISGEPVLDPLLGRILDASFQVLPADRAAVILLDPITGAQGPRTARSRRDEKDSLLLSQTILEEVVERKEAVLLADPRSDARFDRASSLVDEGVRSAMCVPMLHQGELLGVMHVDSLAATAAFTAKDLEIFSTIANQAALAVKTAAVHDRIQAVVVDERRRLERVLRDLPVGVVLLDDAGVITLVNLEAERLLPALGAAAVGDPLPRLGPQPLSELLRSGSGPIDVVLPGPPERHFSVLAGQGTDRGGAVAETVLLISDVTESRAREQAAARAERMALVGRLAGGVAHDFNNLLSVILNHAEYLAEDLDEPEQREDAEVIQQAAHRAARLTGQLLAFSRRELVRPQVLDLNQVVLGTEVLLRRTLGSDIELELILARDLRRLEADPGRVEQVLMNLVVNARDAMPRGGKLTIETRNLDLEDDLPEQQLAAGSYVTAAVRDTGVGMTPDVAQRVFEPFFTTKDVGQGTGLGLASAEGIVRQAGGAIRIQSAPGRGSTFEVCFPATDARPAATATERQETISPGGGKTILVAEDEDSVRSVTSRILRRAGYRVIEARDGEEALALAAQYHVPVDLLIADVVMPHMSGRDLARRLQAVRNLLPVLFMTGQVDLDRYGTWSDDLILLRKPFTQRDLLSRVSQVLSTPPRAD